MGNWNRYKAEDFVDKSFSMLHCTDFLGVVDGRSVGRFRCDCGSVVEKSLSDVVSGRVKSCGCYQKKHPGGYKHGWRHTPTYTSWNAMRSRCNDKSNPNYGGRGVSYDPRWDDFLVFLEDMGEAPPDTQLDKDIKGGAGCLMYSKQNCSWVSRQDNMNNRQTCITDEVKEQMVRLYQKGAEPPEISETLSVCRPSVIKYLRKAGVYRGNKNHLKPSEIERIKELASQGLSQRAIAKLMNRSPSSVRSLLLRG